jgi:sodium-dependent dicarboxylate transporter 2/3/5
MNPVGTLQQRVRRIGLLAGPVLGVPAAVLPVPATIASCAFMMPVGTPPNAIVFGTGLVRMRQMMKAGIWLNLAGIVLIFALTFAVFMPVLRELR